MLSEKKDIPEENKPLPSNYEETNKESKYRLLLFPRDSYITLLSYRYRTYREKDRERKRRGIARYRRATPAMTPTTPTTEPTIMRGAAFPLVEGEAPPAVLVVVTAAMMAEATSELIELAAEPAMAVWVEKKAATPLVPEAMALWRSDEMEPQPATELYLLSILSSIALILEVA